MKSPKTRFVLMFLLAVLLAGLLGASYWKGSVPVSDSTPTMRMERKSAETIRGNKEDIRQLTDERRVIPYVKMHHDLPDYYLTKEAARRLGWQAAAGNLCRILPGRAIGGDVFRNREHRLPERSGRIWREADLNYDCGTRNADRLLYSNDGLIYVSRDHYQTFRRQ